MNLVQGFYILRIEVRAFFTCKAPNPSDHWTRKFFNYSLNANNSCVSNFISRVIFTHIPCSLWPGEQPRRESSRRWAGPKISAAIVIDMIRDVNAQGGRRYCGRRNLLRKRAEKERPLFTDAEYRAELAVRPAYFGLTDAAPR